MATMCYCHLLICLYPLSSSIISDISNTKVTNKTTKQLLWQKRVSISIYLLGLMVFEDWVLDSHLPASKELFVSERALLWTFLKVNEIHGQLVPCCSKTCCFSRVFWHSIDLLIRHILLPYTPAINSTMIYWRCHFVIAENANIGQASSRALKIHFFTAHKSGKIYAGVKTWLPETKEHIFQETKVLSFQKKISRCEKWLLVKESLRFSILVCCLYQVRKQLVIGLAYNDFLFRFG